jgi:hypothetical protein
MNHVTNDNVQCQKLKTMQKLKCFQFLKTFEDSFKFIIKSGSTYNKITKVQEFEKK